MNPVFEEFRKANARKFRGFDAPDANIRAVEGSRPRSPMRKA
jgi:3-hydroxyacyl-CoA dehydrogenase